MRCPKCSAKNAETNRFCRHCGIKLEGLAAPEPRAAPEAAAPIDEVAVGQDLFAVWQLYSTGDVDGALAKLESVSEGLPERASVHSLFALIYERKAEIEMAAGNAESARQLLVQALERCEKVVALNPDSAADREKLSRLRRKLRSKPAARLPGGVGAVMSALRSAPPAVIAAGVVFVIAAGVAGFVWAPGPREEPVRAAKTKKAPAAKSKAGKAPARMSEAAPLRVYTFPSPGGLSLPALTPPQQKPAAQQPEEKPAPVPPLKLPSLPNVKVTQANQEAGKPQPPKPGTARPAGKKNGGSEPAVTLPEASDQADKVDGATVLARAISLHKQGLNEEAVVAARQSIELFQSDIAAGRNVEASKRGVENAKKLISLWQSGQPTPAEE